jgi:hypothetical protein
VLGVVEATMANETRLTALAVKNAGPGRYADGGSLYLDVAPSGSRRWLYRYRAGHRVKDMALGGATIVTLADARALRDKWRRESLRLAMILPRRDALRKRPALFGEVADRVLESERIKSLSNPKHRDQWRYSLTELAGTFRSRSMAECSHRRRLGHPAPAVGQRQT